MFTFVCIIKFICAVQLFLYCALASALLVPIYSALLVFSLSFVLIYLAGIHNKIYSMLWDPYILRCCLLESPMELPFNQQFLLKDLFHTEREQRGCIQLYRLHSLRQDFLRNIILLSFGPRTDIIFFLILSSQVAIEFPYVFGQALIYCAIFYSMASFERTVSKFIWYMFFMYFTMLYFTFYGMMTTAVTPNHNVAAIIAAPFYMLWNLFSGFMIPHKVMESQVLLDFCCSSFTSQ